MAEEQRKCPQCGATYSEGQGFCRSCGASLQGGVLGRLLKKLGSIFGSSSPEGTLNHQKPRIIRREVQTFENIEDLPPELQEEVKRAIEEALIETDRKTGARVIRTRKLVGPIVIKEGGEEKVYRSVEELPPHLREIIAWEESGKSAVKDGGEKKVYHSLDELPPEIRAKIEKKLKEQE